MYCGNQIYITTHIFSPVERANLNQIGFSTVYNTVHGVMFWNPEILKWTLSNYYVGIGRQTAVRYDAVAKITNVKWK